MKRFVLLLVIMLCELGIAVGAEVERPAKVDPWVREATADGATAEYMVFLADQADLRKAAGLKSKTEKAQLVYDALTKVASRTQRPLLKILRSAGVPHRAFWVANMIWVQGDAALAETLAKRSDVARIHANPKVGFSLPATRRAQLRSAQAIEPNLLQLAIPLVFWEAGVRGAGVVFAGQDTGYDWDHPALKHQYRGWDGTTADHNYNWHDAIHAGGGVCGPDASEPCDDSAHGTHTMGTMVGDDGDANQIGVAPAARWIGCRNMDRGYGTPATYSECFEWFLAPTDLNGQNPRPDLAPHVINNSWSCPPVEGCTDPDVLRTVVNNVRAAGIFVAVSAGNSGSGCSSVVTPAAIYDASVTVGSVGSGFAASGFSSRGPVTIDGSGRLKPDLSAPGERIRSSIPGGGYGLSSGTSMASPHVAGMTALLMSAEPCLLGDVDATEAYLKSTTVVLTTTQVCGEISGEESPNNTYGYGSIFSSMPSPTACGAPVGGGAGGIEGGYAVCQNRSGRRSAAVAALDNALAWDCEAAGLDLSPRDRVVIRIHGVASGDTLAGTLTGMVGRSATCRNLTTGQSRRLRLTGGNAWNCSDKGLLAQPGDLVLQTIVGVAD